MNFNGEYQLIKELLVEGSRRQVGSHYSTIRSEITLTISAFYIREVNGTVPICPVYGSCLNAKQSAEGG